MNIQQFYQNNFIKDLKKYKTITIVIPLCKYLVFYELGMMLSNTLTYLGFDNTVDVNDAESYIFDKNNLYILYDTQVFAKNLPENFIIHQYEQMWRVMNYCNPYIIDIFIQTINKAKALWDYSLTNISLYKHINKINIPIYFVPLGYNKYIDYKYRFKHEENIINVSFIGNIQPNANCNRRIRILNNLQKKVNIHIFSNNVWNNDNKKVGSLVNIKAELYIKTKIMLNIYMFDTVLASFDLYRIITGIANKCLVISEYSRDIHMNIIFKPYIILCNYEDMSEHIEYYLKNENERHNLVEKAYNWLISDFSYNNFIPQDNLYITK